MNCHFLSSLYTKSMYAKRNKMNGYEKLIELLEKEKLYPEDENYINSLCANNPEAEKIVQIYKRLKSSTSKENNISIEQLADYVLYLNGQEPEDKNTISLIPEIEKQLRVSKELKKEFELLNSEYSETEQFVANTFIESEKSGKKNLTSDLQGFKKYSIYSLSTAAVVYIILFFAFNIFTPGYKKNIILRENSDNSYTRGRISETFQKSLIYINNDDLQKAIELLNKDISENPDGSTIFYSHYILGMVYLKNSKSNFLGLFKSYNEVELQKGIHELELAIDKNSNTQFKNINLNAYFFIGNAYLALDNIEEAKSYFELVKNEKGAYMKNAENILESFLGER